MKSARRRKIETKLGAMAFGFAHAWIQKKDALGAERLGIRLGRMACRVSKKHRNRAMTNLAMCFPEMSEVERADLTRRVFEHFGIVATDFMRTEVRTDEEVLASMEMDHPEIVDQVLAQGKGMIAVTAHFGNWERAAQFGRASNRPLYAIARDANDKEMNDTVLRLREAAGLQILPRGNAARAMMGALRKNQIVCVLPDQNCSESFVPFFGLPTGTVLGPAVMHLRTGAPMVPFYTARIGPAKYRTICGEPLVAKPGIEDPIEAMTRAMNDSLESVIRQYPEQWLWIHDRWKSARNRGLL